MNRAAAISRARSLLRQRAVRINNKPIISTDELGTFSAVIGKGGIVVRLALRSGEESELEPDSAGLSLSGEPPATVREG